MRHADVQSRPCPYTPAAHWPSPEIDRQDIEETRRLSGKRLCFAAQEYVRYVNQLETINMSTESIKQQLENTPIGTYLMAHGHFGNSINATIEQGTLKNIDWAHNSMVLHSTNYDRDHTVDIGKVTYIDDSRTGSGALGSVQAPDLRRVGNDWYRGDVKVE